VTDSKGRICRKECY